MPTETPTLPAYLKNNQAFVWCQYCQTWHGHGPQPGHRIAHCTNNDSPYNQTGYDLEIVGNWEDRPQN